MRCFRPFPQPLSTRRALKKWERGAVPLYAINQPRGRGVGAVPGLAGYGTPWVSGFRVSWPASPLSQGQPTSINKGQLTGVLAREKPGENG